MKHIDTVYEEEGDGQRIIWHYSRRVKEQWQYAIVTYSDDGEFVSAIVLSNGKAKYVE